MSWFVKKSYATTVPPRTCKQYFHPSHDTYDKVVYAHDLSSTAEGDTTYRCSPQLLQAPMPELPQRFSAHVPFTRLHLHGAEYYQILSLFPELNTGALHAEYVCALRTSAWYRIAGMAMEPTAEKPVRNLPASTHLQAERILLVNPCRNTS